MRKTVIRAIAAGALMALAAPALAGYWTHTYHRTCVWWPTYYGIAYYCR